MFGFRDFFTYFECGNCGTLQITEIPSDISKYYPERYYNYSLREEKKYPVEIYFKKLRDRYAALGRGFPGRILFCFYPDHVMRIYSGFTPDQGILDVGCGSGVPTLELARQCNGKIIGLDINRFLLDFLEKKIQKAVKKFTGKIKQTPPMYSAKKMDGKPLYTLARKGIEVARQAKEIIIYHLELTDFNLPFASFSVTCSSGTYIRTLCDDIGKTLSCGAHLSEIRRTNIGNISIHDAVTIDKLTQEGKGILSPDRALSWIPEIKLKPSAIKKVKNGNPLRWGDIAPPIPEVTHNELLKIKTADESLLAIGTYSETPPFIIKMKIVF